MKNAMTCSFLVVCVVLVFGSKFASGEHGVSRKSSIQVTPIVTVTSTPQLSTVVTDEATFDYSSFILTFTGIINAQGLPTTVWFEYDTVSGSHNNKSSIQDVIGTGDTSVEISVNIVSLPPNESGVIYYYYRMVAENEMGISYGEENSLGLVTSIPDCLCGVSGKVIDAMSKEGIVNATVTGSEGSTSYTNKSGYYVWDNGVIPCTSGGTHYLTASADGYESLTQYIDLQPCVESTLNFELHLAGTPSPIPTAIFTPIPTVVPTPIYDGVKMRASPRTLKLKRKQSSVTTVTIERDNGILKGKTVTAKTGKAGSTYIQISPVNEVTNEHGQAQFTIIAEDKIGDARVVFKADNLKKSMIVRVRK